VHSKRLYKCRGLFRKLAEQLQTAGEDLIMRLNLLVPFSPSPLRHLSVRHKRMMKQQRMAVRMFRHKAGYFEAHSAQLEEDLRLLH
jgi:hypothetical protein